MIDLTPVFRPIVLPVVALIALSSRRGLDIDPARAEAGDDRNR